MERYKDPSLPIEERVADLMSRMTLEEKIMQTDQYSIIGDYTKRNAEERVEEFHWEEFEAALKDKSVGSVQFRSASPQLANQLQRSMDFTTATQPVFLSRSAWRAPLSLSWAGVWGGPSGRRQGPAGFTRPGIR